MVWRTLRHIPLREILVMARERASEEIQATIQGGDGSRIVKVCLSSFLAPDRIRL